MDVDEINIGNFPLPGEEEGERDLDVVEFVADEIESVDPGVLLFNEDMITCRPSVVHDIAGVQFDVQEEGDYLKFTVRRAGNPPSWASISQISQQFDATMGSRLLKTEAKKIRHELVASTIHGGNTDVPLKHVFPTVHANLTPDWITRVSQPLTNPWYLVTELTTRGSENAAHIGWTEKIATYETTLIGAAQGENVGIAFCIIIVMESKVYCNYAIDSGLVDNMLLAYKMGDAMFRAGRNAGLISEDTLEDLPPLDRIAERIRQSVERTPVIEPHGLQHLLIKPDFIHRVVSMEPDMNHATDVWNGIVKKELDGVMKESPDVVNQKSLVQIQKYLREVDSVSSKTKVNSIFNYPLIDPPIDTGVDTGFHIDKANTFLTQFWEHISNNYINIVGNTVWTPIETLKEEAYCDVAEDIQVLEINRKEKRKIRNHYQFGKDVSADLAEYLAMDGISAKGFSSESLSKKVKESREAYKWDTNTTDVDEFIANQNLWEQSDYAWCDALGSQEDVLNLLEQSLLLVGSKVTIPMDFVREVVKTKLFRALTFISDLMMELAVARKSHVKEKSCIAKRMKNYKCYLAIYPTKSSEHIFVSIMFPKAERKPEILSFLPFRQPEIHQGHIIYPFVSFKQHKMKNPIIAPSTFLGSLSFWMHQLGHPLHTSDAVIPKKVRTMVLHSLMVSLEDKSSTEEVITASRYMYVDIMNSEGRFTRPNPFKMLKKFPVYMRSRFTLWNASRILQAFETMGRLSPKKVSAPPGTEATAEDIDDAARDHFAGLINFVTMEESKRASEIINTFYQGYFVNKDKVSEDNADYLLIGKLIKACIQVKPSESAESVNWDPADPKPQQFSMKLLVTASDLLKKRLEDTEGEHWQMGLEYEIYKMCSQDMTHELATMKASLIADFGSLSVDKKDPQGKVRRMKVIEAMYEMKEKFGLNPFQVLDEIIQEFEAADLGQVIALFKKNQHGGIREISIMDIRGRVLCRFIENIARCLCKKFPSETITHPDNKLTLIESHKRQVQQRAGVNNAEIIEGANSSDKTTWNQNLTMQSLSLLLFRLTPSSMHGAIQRILNLWVNKHVMIPKSVMDLLTTNTQLHDEAYEVLRSQFRKQNVGDEFKLLPTPMAGWLTVESGMLQGLLHYLSSLLHVALLYLTKELILKGIEMGKGTMVTHVCSSDDSALLVSRLVDKQRVDETTADYSRRLLGAKILLEANLRAGEDLSRWFSMVPSVKSVIAANNFIEYNSDYIVANNLIPALVKFISCAFNVTESENFTQRFHSMGNLLTDVFSKGLPAHNTGVVQIAQGMVHYKMMGCNMTPLWPDFFELISQYPEPNLGFFPMDNVLVPGLLGASYSMFHIRRNAGILRIPSRGLVHEAVSVDREGHIVEDLKLKMGDSKRYKSLLNKISGGNSREQLIDVLNKNPHILYMTPQNPLELEAKFWIKGLSPGVENSLTHGDQFMKGLESSVYSIWTHCWTKHVSEVDDEGQISKRSEKTSLLLELTKKLAQKESKDPRFLTDDDPAELKKWFPYSYNYTRFYDVLDQMRVVDMFQYKPNRRSKQNKFIVNNMAIISNMTLLEVVRIKWFGQKTTKSQAKIERNWESFRIMNPWLRLTHDESLLLSPFPDAVSMFNYINSDPNRRRTVNLYIPPIRSQRLLSQLLTIARRCPATDHELTTSLSDSSFVPKEKNFSRIFLSLCIPDPESRAQHCREAVGELEIDQNDLSNLDSVSRKDADAMIMFAYSKGIINESFVTDHLMKGGYGLILSYVKEQQKRFDKDGKPYFGGKGLFRFRGKDIVIEVSVQDDEVRFIKSSNRKLLRNYHRTLVEILQGQRIASFYKVSAAEVYLGGNVIPGGYGTPYSDLELSVVHLADSHYVIDWDYFRVSLYQVIGNVKALVLYVSPSDHNITILRTDNTPTKKLWDAWTQSRPVVPATATVIINSIVNLEEKSQYWHLRDWIRDTLKARLHFRGFIGETMQTMENLDPFNTSTREIEPSPEEPEVTATMIMNATKNLLSQMGDFLDQEDNQETDFLAGLKLSLNEVHRYNRSVVKKARDVYKETHPIWDLLLKTVEVRSMMDGVRSEGSQIHTNLQKLLGIKIQDVSSSSDTDEEDLLG